MAEKVLCDGRKGAERAAAYAKRWVAKEATLKALGSNDATAGVAFHEIEVVNTKSGRPTLRLWGGAQRQLAYLLEEKAPGKVAELHLSISDYYPTAVAAVMIEARDA
jgi:holo-[acyl-carrier protein] synthase